VLLEERDDKDPSVSLFQPGDLEGQRGFTKVGAVRLCFIEFRRFAVSRKLRSRSGSVGI
jgi:hypothetical protein